MSKDIINLQNPEFLFCENPIKTGNLVEDNRNFIYCVQYLSLIEVVPYELYLASFPSNQIQKEFIYKSDLHQEEETFLLVFTQNNVELINSQFDEILHKDKITPPLELLNQAWNYYKNYLIWEDKQNYNELS